MDRNAIQRFLKRLGSASGARFVLPRLVLEIEPEFILGARLDARGRSLRRLGVRELQPHTLEPMVHGSNLTNAADFRQALEGVRAVVGHENGSFGVLLPDGAARVVVLNFETLPADPQEAKALIRWRLKDSFPGSSEEVRLSYQTLGGATDHVELLAIAVSQSVLLEYVQALGPMNGGPILVLPVTLALLPLLGEGGPGELLIHVCAGWMTTVVHEEGCLRSWRSRDVGWRTPEELAADLIREAARVLASASDRLKVEVQRVRLCLRPRAEVGWESELARVVSKEVTRLLPDSRCAGKLSEGEQRLFENLAAPLVGLISNAE